ncbi:MAG: HD domain-containing protein [Candidatus Dormibacteraceae bacterium]
MSEQELIDSPWLQRLRRIRQLQTATWVYATAEHSRFTHSLGAMHLAGRWAAHLYPSLIKYHPAAPSQALVVETLRLAGLLHDVGHGPFGHFFEENYLQPRWGIDHETVWRQIILRCLAPLITQIAASPEADFAVGEAIEPAWVAELISPVPLPGFSPPEWLLALKPLLLGPFSADNMDYVPRDASMCGVAVGPVDVDRILHYSFFSPQGLCLHIHGSEALFMFLSARLYLYQQVYFHRTVRRIDLQLREIFAPTIDQLLSQNPLENLDAFYRLNEWGLLGQVESWSDGEGNPEQIELGLAWAELLRRRFSWRLVYSDYSESHQVEGARSREVLAERIRERLGPELVDLEFEVDLATRESGAFNPLREEQDILFYDPLGEEYRCSRIDELFRRLPVRMALCRVFSRGERGRTELGAAARQVLG